MKYLLSSEALDMLSRKADSHISETVQDLIQSVIRSKASNYEFEFYKENVYLPQSLRKTNLEKKILSINLELMHLSQKYNFSRLQELGDSSGVNDSDNVNDLNEIDRYNVVSLFLDCLTKEEFEEYSQFELSEKDLRLAKHRYRHMLSQEVDISLPRFELMTDYFGMMGFFDILFDDYKSGDINQDNLIDDCESEDMNRDNLVSEFKNPGLKFRFKSNLNESKILLLYNNLIVKNCISHKTSKEEFLWVFGVDNFVVIDCRIEWLKSKSLAVYFIDSLYNYNFITNNLRIWSIGGKVLGIKNMAQIKQNYISINSQGKPKDYELIDEIIDFL